MKRKKKITVTRWAIVSSPGYWPMHISTTRRFSIQRFCGDSSEECRKLWKHWYRKGLRAVKVQVSFEIEGG